MQIQRYAAKGQLVPLLFSENAVAASQTNAQLPLMAVDIVASLVDGYAMPFAGEIVAVSWVLDTAGTAGVFTIGATVGGTEDADTTQTVGTAVSGTGSVVRGLAKFVAGDLIGCEITTDGSWDGTASDLIVQVWVLLALEGI